MSIGQPLRPERRGPVFVGGIAGTGKTRLGTLLGVHPNLSVTRRTYLWRRIYGRFGDLSVDHNRERCIAAVLEIPGVARLGVDGDRLRADLTGGEASYGRLFDAVHRQVADRRGKPRWVDQLGLVECFAEQIFDAYPDARMIHLLRDPRGVPVSERPGRTGWMVGKWRTSARLAELNDERFGPRYLVVRYEDLDADESGTLEQICAFIGEEPDPAMNVAPPSRDVAPETRAPRRHRFIESCVAGEMAHHGYMVVAPPRPLRGALARPVDGVAYAAWRQVREPRGPHRSGTRAGVGT